MTTLTKRQAQVSELTARGLCAKEIARELGISRRTVEDHKHDAYAKLGVRNAVELARKIWGID